MNQGYNSTGDLEAQNAPTALRQKFHEWLYEHTLPTWQQQGMDFEAGGFHEKLDLNCRPIISDGKRLVVQARQIFVYSYAAVNSLLDGALETAHHGFNFLITHYRSEQGWRHSVQRDGRALDNQCDLYDQAFVVFSMAWLFRASRDKEVLRIAEETLEILDTKFSDKVNGGYKEGLDANGQTLHGPRRQNPHMHLLEALIALHEATGNIEYLDRARKLIALTNDKFIVDGSLREYFSTDLTPLSTADGFLVEPGHHFEWVWLLYRYSELSGSVLEIEKMVEQLYRFAVEHGINAQNGGVYDQVDYRGNIVKTSRRVWPQTEAIKAHAIRTFIAGDTQAQKWHDATLTTLLHNHLSTSGLPKGAWIEHTNLDGINIMNVLPGSTLYHLVVACSETERLANIVNSR